MVDGPSGAVMAKHDDVKGGRIGSRPCLMARVGAGGQVGSSILTWGPGSSAASEEVWRALGGAARVLPSHKGCLGVKRFHIHAPAGLERVYVAVKCA